MNALDLLLLGLVVLAVLSGYRRGALLQILSRGGLLLGLVVGAAVAPHLASTSSSPITQIAISIGSVLGCAVAGNVLGWIAGSRLRSVARGTRLRVLDAWGGVAISLATLALVVWFAAYSLVNGPFVGLAQEIRGSAVVQVLDAALPAPPALLSRVREFLSRFPFPQVFAGLPPPPGGSVTEPGSKDVAAAVEAAQASTVKVEGRACGGVQEGSGFVIASNYVVTNAHVVAGMPAPTVLAPGSSTPVAAVPVLFDPRMDLAILRVGTTPGPILHLDAATVPRGVGGAILGYPNGGPLTGNPAAVRGTIAAVGRDIYGRSMVTRDVYDLQTVVRPGNSGGPFVLPDGEVAGVVFAASTTEASTGYALTSVEIGQDVRSGVVRTARVSTGGCVR